MPRPHRYAAAVPTHGFGAAATSLPVGLLALVCGTVVGFELTLNTEARNDADFGYQEALSAPTSSSSAAPPADATSHCIATNGAQKQTDDSDEAIADTTGTRNPSFPRF